MGGGGLRRAVYERSQWLGRVEFNQSQMVRPEIESHIDFDRASCVAASRLPRALMACRCICVASTAFTNFSYLQAPPPRRALSTPFSTLPSLTSWWRRRLIDPRLGALRGCGLSLRRLSAPLPRGRPRRTLRKRPWAPRTSLAQRWATPISGAELPRYSHPLVTQSAGSPRTRRAIDACGNSMK